MKLSHAAGSLALVAFLAGCGQREVILPGERLDTRAIYGAEAADAVGEAPRAVPISLPAARTNADWTHRNGSAAHQVTHPALRSSPVRVWSAGIGSGDSRRNRITADPVVAGGRIFTMDALARIAATSTSGQSLWQTDLTPASDRSGDASGGGIAYGEGLVFATTGFGELVALDPASGAVAWRQKFDGPVGGAPTVSGGLVYVVTRNAVAWAVDARNGKVKWQLPGTPSLSGVTGVSAPAVDARMAVFPFPSGELVAALRKGGVQLWSGQVAGRRLGRAYATVGDLTGDPVLADGRVYAATSAGRLAALDVNSGERLWTADEGATSPVWPVGGSVYLISDEARLVRIDAATGQTIWAVDMPYYVKDRPKRFKAITAHYGPVLAGGVLNVASSDGVIRRFDPSSGAALSPLELPGGAASAPVVAGGTLYAVSENGQLNAFR